MLPRWAYIVAALFVTPFAEASIYSIKSENYKQDEPGKAFYAQFQRAEKMFASEQGPFFAKSGASSIEVRRLLYA
jgi:hypothetical protein